MTNQPAFFIPAGTPISRIKGPSGKYDSPLSLFRRGEKFITTREAQFTTHDIKYTLPSDEQFGKHGGHIFKLPEEANPFMWIYVESQYIVDSSTMTDKKSTMTYGEDLEMTWP